MWGKEWGKEKWCNGTQGGTQDGTQGGTQSGTQDTQDDTEGDTQMIPKNKYLTSSTIQYLPKTNLGSLLITSKLPLMYERRILVLFSKATFSIYIMYICVHVFTYSWIHVQAYFSKTSPKSGSWRGSVKKGHEGFLGIQMSLNILLAYK